MVSRMICAEAGAPAARTRRTSVGRIGDIPDSVGWSCVQSTGTGRRSKGNRGRGSPGKCFAAAAARGRLGRDDRVPVGRRGPDRGRAMNYRVIVGAGGLLLAAGLAAGQQSVSINLAGVQIRNATNQSRS